MIALALLFLQAPDPALEKGARIFAQSCAVGYCHGTAGAANRGPRLAGRGFDRSYVDKVVRDGIPGTGMPGFKALPPDDLTAVIAYVMNISGGGATSAPPAHMPAPEAPKFAGPPEAKKGKDLFFDAARGTRCGTCHAVQDWGLPIGPNLTAKLPASPSAIRSAKTANVKLATTTSSQRFPALLVDRKPNSIALYDLTSTPPVLRHFLPAEVKLESSASWSHATAIQSYSDSDLTAILAYLNWVAR